VARPTRIRNDLVKPSRDQHDVGRSVLPLVSQHTTPLLILVESRPTRPGLYAFFLINAVAAHEGSVLVSVLIPA
jgi:hypothetical protein